MKGIVRHFHRHQGAHFEGPEDSIDVIIRRIVGYSFDLVAHVELRGYKRFKGFQLSGGNKEFNRIPGINIGLVLREKRQNYATLSFY